MIKQARKTEAPPESKIIALIANSDFHDAWSIESDRMECSALEHFMATAKRSPHWIDVAMQLRNWLVTWVGLKNLGALSDFQPQPIEHYQAGVRIGIFTLFENSFDEVLLGDRDKHLDVMLSVHRKVLNTGQHLCITVTTVVHIHNWLGKLYMIPVKPMHRIIVPRVLSNIR